MAKILLVDDEPQVAKALARLLRRGGFEVELAASGAEALEKLSSFQADAVISDFRMPGMTGAELLAIVKKSQPLNNYADGTLMKVAVDGGAATLLADGGAFYAVVVDATSIYWLNGGSLLKTPLAGGAVTTLASGVGQNFAVDATSVYWIGYSTDGGTVMKLTPK